MRIADIWNKFYLYGTKVIVLIVILTASYANCSAQKLHWVKRNNPNYDQRKLTYGFLMGLHSSSYQIKYSDNFVTDTKKFDTLYAVQPQWSPGFVLGLIINYRLGDLVDLRMTPQFAFYEHRLDYMYTDDTPTEQHLVETTVVEIPIQIKYKSERRGNVRMYMIGGIKPGFEASGKKGIDNTVTSLEVKGFSTNLDIGFGFDLYYPLFKFSPEIRFSRGITNILDNTTNKYGAPLKSVNTNTVTVYFLFQ
jgi:hypothetical protein